MPFEAAVEMLATLVGVKVSKASAIRMTEAAGAAYVAIQEEAVAELEREAPPAPGCSEPMVMSADGAMAPLLHGEWGEVRTVAIGVATETAQSAQPAARCEDSAMTDSASGQAGKPLRAPEIHVQAISYFSRLTTADRQIN